MIVKNEEKTLEKSIDSIKNIVDQIVIVDTGSTDKTIDIAKNYTSEIYNFKWIDDFSAAQNFALQFSTCDFNMKWDADFVLSPESKTKLKKLKDSNFKNNNLIALNWFFDYGTSNKSKSIIRPLIFKTKDFYYKYPVHEIINPKEGIVKKYNIFTDICVYHMKETAKIKLRENQNKIIIEDDIKNNPDDPQSYFSYGGELLHDKKYIQAIEVFEKYIFITKKIKNDEKRMIVVEKLLRCYLALKKLKEADDRAELYFKEYKKYPRFLLIYADIKALTDIKKAEEIYNLYFKIKFDISNATGSFDPERYHVHPLVMMGKILMLKNNNQEAKSFFQKALNKTRIEKTKQEILSLLRKI
ncbi:MAG: glycosyltransferase family 2 protein [bacterium]